VTAQNPPTLGDLLVTAFDEKRMDYGVKPTLFTFLKYAGSNQQRHLWVLVRLTVGPANTAILGRLEEIGLLSVPPTGSFP